MWLVNPPPGQPARGERAKNCCPFRRHNPALSEQNNANLKTNKFFIFTQKLVTQISQKNAKIDDNISKPFS
jgi:hypothetical protein